MLPHGGLPGELGGGGYRVLLPGEELGGSRAGVFWGGVLVSGGVLGGVPSARGPGGGRSLCQGMCLGVSGGGSGARGCLYARGCV